MSGNMSDNSVFFMQQVQTDTTAARKRISPPGPVSIGLSGREMFNQIKDRPLQQKGLLYSCLSRLTHYCRYQIQPQRQHTTPSEI